MQWLAFLRWTVHGSFKSIFFCNHARTPVNEGKCYCPDCGRGLIYQWVVIRCLQCQKRIESQTVLRQVLPACRCCPHCGESSFQAEYLESPSYFQLHKASLQVWEEHDYLGAEPTWSVYSIYNWGETVSQTVKDALEQSQRWISGSTTKQLALLPAPVQ